MSYCKFWIYWVARVDTKFTIWKLYSLTQPRAHPEIFQRRGMRREKKGRGWSEKVLVYSRYIDICVNIKIKKMYKLYNWFSLVHFPFVCFRLAYFITFIYIFFYLKGGIPHPPGSANAYTCISLCICFSLTLSLFPPNSCL